MTPNDALKLTASKRKIVYPNLSFTVQLQNFYDRLYKPSNFMYYPKTFAVGLQFPAWDNYYACHLVFTN